MGPNVFLAAAVLMTALSSSASAQPATAGPKVACDEGKAQFAVGRRYSKWFGRRARWVAHARTLRVLRPGEMHTMDFDDTRLNLYLDGHGIVTSVKCG